MADNAVTTKHSNNKKSRNPALDRMKGFLVIGMLLSHTLNFFPIGTPFFCVVFSTYISTMTFPGFLFGILVKLRPTLPPDAFVFPIHKKHVRPDNPAFMRMLRRNDVFPLSPRHAPGSGKPRRMRKSLHVPTGTVWDIPSDGSLSLSQKKRLP